MEGARAQSANPTTQDFPRKCGKAAFRGSVKSIASAFYLLYARKFYPLLSSYKDPATQSKEEILVA